MSSLAGLAGAVVLTAAVCIGVMGLNAFCTRKERRVYARCREAVQVRFSRRDALEVEWLLGELGLPERNAVKAAARLGQVAAIAGVPPDSLRLDDMMRSLSAVDRAELPDVADPDWERAVGHPFCVVHGEDFKHHFEKHASAERVDAHPAFADRTGWTEDDLIDAILSLTLGEYIRLMD